MKDALKNINKLFDHRIRLAIMSALLVNERMDFSALKELLDVTDGNLASHIKALENANYVLVEKKFVGKKPNTSYSVSQVGRKAFNNHLNALEELLGK
jgi:DNA-binding MarR family transcriptional regulator